MSKYTTIRQITKNRTKITILLHMAFVIKSNSFRSFLFKADEKSACFLHHSSVSSSPFTKQQDIDLLKELVETGKYKPLIDRSYPLEDIVSAYKYVETGQKVGNVILTIIR